MMGEGGGKDYCRGAGWSAFWQQVSQAPTVPAIWSKQPCHQAAKHSGSKAHSRAVLPGTHPSRSAAASQSRAAATSPSGVECLRCRAASSTPPWHTTEAPGGRWRCRMWLTILRGEGGRTAVCVCQCVYVCVCVLGARCTWMPTGSVQPRLFSLPLSPLSRTAPNAGCLLPVTATSISTSPPFNPHTCPQSSGAARPPPPTPPPQRWIRLGSGAARPWRPKRSERRQQPPPCRQRGPGLGLGRRHWRQPAGGEGGGRAGDHNNQFEARCDRLGVLQGDAGNRDRVCRAAGRPQQVELVASKRASCQRVCMHMSVGECMAGRGCGRGRLHLRASTEVALTAWMVRRIHQ